MLFLFFFSLHPSCQQVTDKNKNKRMTLRNQTKLVSICLSLLYLSLSICFCLSAAARKKLEKTGKKKQENEFLFHVFPIWKKKMKKQKGTRNKWANKLHVIFTMLTYHFISLSLNNIYKLYIIYPCAVPFFFFKKKKKRKLLTHSPFSV